MPFLNLDINYFDHPKTKRLVRLLGKGSEVLPLRLWVYAARYFVKDGRLTGISAQEIESECLWWGKSGEMVAAMVREDVEFLDRDGDGFAVHDWSEHQGHLWAFQERGKAAARKRWGKDDARSSATRNATSITTSNAPTNQPTNQPTNHPEKRGADPAMEEANAVILRSSRRHEIAHRVGSIAEMFRQHPHAIVREAFAEAEAKRATRPVDYASTIVSRRAAELSAAQKTSPAGPRFFRKDE